MQTVYHFLSYHISLLVGPGTVPSPARLGDPPHDVNPRHHPGPDPPPARHLPDPAPDVGDGGSQAKSLVHGHGGGVAGPEDLETREAGDDADRLPLLGGHGEARVLHEGVVEVAPEAGPAELHAGLGLVDEEDGVGGEGGVEAGGAGGKQGEGQADGVVGEEGETGHAGQDVGVDGDGGAGGPLPRGDELELGDGVAAGVVEAREEEHGGAGGGAG